ncbi:MAG TPA: Ig-like domain-containing protein, partial [Candidatus Limnocylindrales bacterium]|nr:Ig-like domain-containing protein [Candidatus Limnocylindrales bacterium]
MYRGGSRWSIAIGALFALSLVAPAAANASTPVTLTLAASVNSPDSDLPMLLTATANPAVAGISVEVEDKSNGTSFPGRTASDGTLQWDIRPLATTYNGAHFFQAISPDDGTFGAAMSNTVEIDFNRHHAAITLVPSAGGSSVITNLDPLILKARVASPDCDGWFDIFQTPGGRVDSGFAAPLLEDGTTECGLDLNLGLEPLGPLTFIADYSQTYANDPGNSGSISFNVTLIPTTTLVTSSRTYLPAGTTTKLTAQVTAPVHSELVTGSGTVTFLDGSTSLGSVPLSDAGDGSASLNVELDTLGPHNLHAAYSGTSDASPSDNSVTVTVLDELAHAVDDGLSASTFYPVVDTYGDTVSINGELAEPEAVSITISNVATGAVVRRFYEPMTGPADYSVVWDGRSVTSTQGTDSKGVRRPPTVTSKLVPAGTYRITTIITD